MAKGLAPKDPGHRRRYNQPARGEWVDLQPPSKPVLAPADPLWVPEAQRLWTAVRKSGISLQYDDADIQALEEFMRHFREYQPNEQRLRMESFGMTPKGKRDLRWRTPGEVSTIKANEAKRAEV